MGCPAFDRLHRSKPRELSFRELFKVTNLNIMLVKPNCLMLKVFCYIRTLELVYSAFKPCTSFYTAVLYVQCIPVVKSGTVLKWTYNINVPCLCGGSWTFLSAFVATSSLLSITNNEDRQTGHGL